MRYIIFFILILFPGTSVLAQNPSLIYGAQSLTIDLEPAFPVPEQVFIATLNDYSLPIQGAGIRWFVDGELLAESRNERSIELVAPILGESVTLEAVIDIQGGGSLTARQVIEPVYLDIIIEPQTRTPAFYQGRALPSIGSQINATAIVNGNKISPNELLYTWRVNNDAIESGSVRGKNTVSFTMPRGRAATLSLEVRRVSGETLARRLFSLTNSTPRLRFYEKNTLLGASTKAVRDTLAIIGNSVTVRAEPYYLDLNTYNDPDHIEWTIDNNRVSNPGTNPYEAELTKASLGGSSLIEFHVRDTSQVLQGANDGFRISY
jgi:hypothetical protein